MAPYLCLVEHGPPNFPGKGTDQMFHTYTVKKTWLASLKLWGKQITIIASFQFIEFNRNHNPVLFDGNSYLLSHHLQDTSLIFCTRLTGKQQEDVILCRNKVPQCVSFLYLPCNPFWNVKANSFAICLRHIPKQTLQDWYFCLKFTASGSFTQNTQLLKHRMGEQSTGRIN